MAQGDWLEGAVVLAGPTEHELEGERADLVLLPEGRIGYATSTAFRPVGEDAELQRVAVNTAAVRGTCVVSLMFTDGEVRERIDASAASVGKALRDEGYAVSVARLGDTEPAPPAQPVEHFPGSDLLAGHDETAATAIVVPAMVRATPATPVAPRMSKDSAAPGPIPVTGTDLPAKRPRFAAVSARVAALAARGVFGLLRVAVLIVGLVVVAVLVIYVLLVLTNANPHNDLVRFFARVSKPLAWKFKDLFLPRTRKANITENYGLAAIVYLVVTVAVARVLAALTPAKEKAK